jgi:hypothetical protein
MGNEGLVAYARYPTKKLRRKSVRYEQGRHPGESPAVKEAATRRDTGCRTSERLINRRVASRSSEIYQ